MRILLIEDDKQVAQVIKEEMTPRYAVDLAFTAKTGENKASSEEYDVLIIDIVLPDYSGVKVCRHLREAGLVLPIIMLTGVTDVIEKVTALDAGADDYLTKPFSMEELLARVRALLRRRDDIKPNIFSVGELVIDTTARTVMRAKQPIHLRPKEFNLLEYLMRNTGRVVTRTMIWEHVWGKSGHRKTNTVDVHLKYLRDKIDGPFKTKLIQTLPGIGYKIVE